MRQVLLDNNYIHLPQFISADRAKAIALEFKQYAKEYVLPGDEQAPNSSSAYNHVAFAELLCEKSPHVAQLIGEGVFPTYAYGRVYRKGDDLKVHKDRDACEISVTITLEQSSPWPIYIRKPDGEVAKLVLNPGDAMIYLGCDAEHWRDVLQEEEHVQVFLHYVKSRGPRSAYLFDNKLQEKPPLASNKVKEQLAKTKYPSNLADYILYVPKMFPEDLLSRVLQEYQSSDEWQQARVGMGAGAEDITVRGAKTINISIPETISRNEQVRQQLDADLLFYVNKSIKAYAEAYPECNIVKDSGYELLRYNVGMGYKQHIDNFIDAPRAVSCSIAVNDDYEGGEFTFFDQTISYKQEKGSVLLFPSSFQYPHQVNPVTKGVRYSIITWFS